MPTRDDFVRVKQAAQNPFGEAAIADEFEPAGDEPTEAAIRV